MDPISGCFLGHEALDSQHSLLFQIAGNLQASLKAGAGEAVLADCLERLLAYMAFHFSAEDRLMMEVDYPDAASHQHEHISALTAVRQFDQAFRAGDLSAAEETMRFTESWVNGHIPNADRRLVEWLTGATGKQPVNKLG